MVVAAIPVIAGGLYEGIKVLYRTGADVNAYMDSHIKEMKASETPTVARSGAVLEGAKFGFGFGYTAPVVIIVAGQLLLGNPVAAGKFIFSAGTLTNPIAMTCAAVGAIYWGWSALSKKEQEEILQTLSTGLDVGIEFIRSVIRFVINKTKALIGEKNFKELESQVTAAREQIKVLVKPILDSVGNVAGGAIDAAAESVVAAVETTTAYWKKLKAVILTRDKACAGGQEPAEDQSG